MIRGRCLAALTLLLAGCAPQVSSATSHPDPPPPVENMVTDAMVRLRTAGCGVAQTGSGFFVAEDLVVTNRHVVEGATTIEVTTWDGEPLDVVETAVVADGGPDLASVRVAHRDGTMLDVRATAAFGVPVSVFGYPAGQPLTVTEGVVTDAQADGSLAVSAFSTDGNSGGPVVDEAGEVVAVVWGHRRKDHQTLTVPASTLSRFLAGGLNEIPNPSCKD